MPLKQLMDHLRTSRRSRGPTRTDEGFFFFYWNERICDDQQRLGQLSTHFFPRLVQLLRSLRAVTSLCMSTTARKWSFAGRPRGPVTEINFLMKIRIRSGKRCPAIRNLLELLWIADRALTCLSVILCHFQRHKRKRVLKMTNILSLQRLKM